MTVKKRTSRLVLQISSVEKSIRPTSICETES